MRTIISPSNNSALDSSVVRGELQTLETEISHLTSGHDHDGTDSKKIPEISSTHFDSLDGSSIINILETAITDGILLCRVAGDETITGTWSFNNSITNLSLITPKITTSINDVNGLEVINIGSSPTSVNEIKVSNAPTGFGPIIEATGETNVDLFLRPKGSGTLRLGTANLHFPNTDGDSSQVLSTDGSGTLSFIDQTTAPLATTLIPKPVQLIDSATANQFTPQPLNNIGGNNGIMFVGQIDVSKAILVNSISIRSIVETTEGKYRIAIYTLDGQTKLIDVETAQITSETTLYSTVVPSVSLDQGIYYVAIVPVSTVDYTMAFYATNSIYDDTVAGKAIVEGYGWVSDLGASPGNFPATFSPATDITRNDDRTLWIRLDT